ncbi:MAG TPA: type I-E CRISPR-associated protein Cas7/Cse4/CasC [Candidatus Acidoferrum sp.]|jgi:CRISPR system Cascade subunit CasC|nr:type I-E CRISPR-associated protein Cas7/Cse4/CasC [Candidatus Acidoferrum sp.]
MSRFIQLHGLKCYPPSNLNRDDTGRPKTAFMGGAERLRISSQALKRAIRTSEIFKAALEGRLGERTQRFGEEIEKHLLSKGAAPEKANSIAREIAQVFGKVEAVGEKGAKEKQKEELPSPRTAQLAFIGPKERAEALALAERKLQGETIEVAPELILKRADTAADIAMFGRMLADNPDFNREAAVQVAHAITTHKVAVEDDFYTAVDDLKTAAEDAGAGFMGELGFGSGVFYLYVCVDRELLVKNLGGDEALAKASLSAFTEALAKVSPTGKQASFASRAYASYLLAEKGSQQPRTLACAFTRPVRGDDLVAESIKVLEATRDAMDKAYGACADARETMNVPAETGSLAAIQAFVTQW